jgi:hypothetical protein
MFAYLRTNVKESVPPAPARTRSIEPHPRQAWKREEAPYSLGTARDSAAVREMKRYGILLAAFDAAKDPIDFFLAQRAC